MDLLTSKGTVTIGEKIWSTDQPSTWESPRMTGMQLREIITRTLHRKNVECIKVSSVFRWSPIINISQKSTLTIARASALCSNSKMW